MKRISVARCASQLLGPRPRRPQCPFQAARIARQQIAPHDELISRRWQSAVAIPKEQEFEEEEEDELQDGVIADPSAKPVRSPKPTRKPRRSCPSPHPHAATQSVRLHALRSRLSLPPQFPLQALARTLVHPSAEPDPAFNNAALSMLGRQLLGYYTSEWLLCNYPRLPMSIIFAAVEAYIGPRALATLASEWGIEAAFAPGSEVDPGLLQFIRLASGEDLPPALRRQVPWKWNVTTTHKIMRTDEFGSQNAPPTAEDLHATPVPLDDAAQSFVRALFGALHQHLGAPTVKRFFRDHILSRHLDLSTLFELRTPTRDLSRLCAREGFEAPVARLISETGRMSRHPVFVVGVYSGADKLGEGAGSSLNEARFRAAAAALKGWYLYRPLEVTVPSSTEGGGKGAEAWRRNMVDCGEVIV